MASTVSAAVLALLPLWGRWQPHETTNLLYNDHRCAAAGL